MAPTIFTISTKITMLVYEESQCSAVAMKLPVLHLSSARISVVCKVTKLAVWTISDLLCRVNFLILGKIDIMLRLMSCLLSAYSVTVNVNW